MRAVPFVFVALTAAGVGALSAARPAQLPDAVAPGGPGKPADVPYGVGGAPFAHIASTSCAASSCHGGGEPGRKWSEHSTWAPTVEDSPDPHAKAYRVLFNELSVEMGKRLGIKEPHNDQRCLTCHAVVEGGSDPTIRDQILSEGVGCGGCHGPAQKWNAAHVAPQWKGLSNEAKWKDYGFVPTKNLVARALNCAGCHVGDETRDMNHDFIAVGHPRLAFEPASFHATNTYRKHWAEKASARDFEVRMWVIGQAATLRAAVNLLHTRATKAAKADGTPWPEFSGYSCYACHQKIGDPDLRGALSATARKPGVPGWEVWSNANLKVAADTCGLAFPGVSSPELPNVEKLRSLMDGTRAPDPAKVADLAAAARADLDRWLARLQAADDRGPGVKDGAERLILAKIAAGTQKDGKLADHDWDALASGYLGAASMFAATGGKNGPAAKAWGDPLGRIGGALKFPGGTNSPGAFAAPDLGVIRDQFKNLSTTTGSPEVK